LGAAKIEEKIMKRIYLNFKPSRSNISCWNLEGVAGNGTARRMLSFE
jgi:hypothetical protein